VEARFLYLVATHSGYFTVRQFLEFAKAKSGKRNARLVEKLFALGHVSSSDADGEALSTISTHALSMTRMAKASSAIEEAMNLGTSKPGC
jgi:hypothetical protein